MTHYRPFGRLTFIGSLLLAIAWAIGTSRSICAQDQGNTPNEPAAAAGQDSAESLMRAKQQADAQKQEKDASVSDGTPQNLEQLLKQALEHNADLIAAQSRLALAQAELEKTRADLVRQIVALQATIQSRKVAVDLATNRLDAVSDKIADGGGHPKQNDEELREARGAFLTAQIDLEKARTDLQLLTGAPIPEDDPEAGFRHRLRIRTADKGLATEESSMATWAIPRGRSIRAADNRFAEALSQQIKLDFTDLPLADVLAYLSDRTGIPFYGNWEALEMSAQVPSLGKTTALTLTIGPLPLRADLQAIEDHFSGKLCFVVRDYGILLTSSFDAGTRGLPVVTREEADSGSFGGADQPANSFAEPRKKRAGKP